MLGAKPSLRLIHYHGLIVLWANITPWITVLSCHVAKQTSQDQFTVCNFLFVKVHKEIIVLVGELCALSLILKEKVPCVLHLPLLPRGVSVICRMINKTCWRTNCPSSAVMLLRALKQPKHWSWWPRDFYFHLLSGIIIPEILFCFRMGEIKKKSKIHGILLHSLNQAFFLSHVNMY